MEQLPLFPLNTVLFPGIPLALHIFEERYKQMIGRCLKEERPFGVVLIARGAEVGEPAVPRKVGTSARIVRAEELDDGRYNLIAVGDRRYVIEEVVQERPFLVARVAWTEPGEPEESEEPLVEQVRSELTAYLDRMFELMDQPREEVDLPSEPEQLSFVTAAVLQIGLEKKQLLLETPTARERLRQELELLAAQAEVQDTLRHLKPTMGLVTPLDPSQSRQRPSLN